MERESLQISAALRTWVEKRGGSASSGGPWGWLRRKIATMGERVGQQSCARSDTEVPIYWVVKIFKIYELSDSSMFREESGDFPIPSGTRRRDLRARGAKPARR